MVWLLGILYKIFVKCNLINFELFKRVMAEIIQDGVKHSNFAAKFVQILSIDFSLKLEKSQSLAQFKKSQNRISYWFLNLSQFN